MRYNLEEQLLTPDEGNNAHNSTDNNVLCQVSDSDIFFAKERLGLHKSTPEEGVSLQVLKNYIRKKYGI